MDSKDLRIVFMGTPEFAVASLAALVDGGYNVVAAVTTPDKPAGRGLRLHQSALKEYALAKNIPLFQPEKLKNPDWIEEFKSLKPDLAIVVAFRMLPEVIWNTPTFGTFNLHASLLPRYRGAAPINWAVINGDSQTGVTTFFLDHQIDSGAIIDAKKIDITLTDTAGSLHDKLMVAGAELVIATVDKIAAGTVILKHQNVDEATPAPKIFKEDCKIDWNCDIQQVYDKIRGLSPYPAAWCEMNGSTAKILEVEMEKVPHQLSCGTFENYNAKYIRVSCKGGWLHILRLQMAGKKAMSAADFLRGNAL